MITLLVLYGASSSAFAAFGFKLDGTLDKEAISHAYFEGDFARVLPPLEMFRQSAENPSKEDQIFVYKYLSVIYAADSSTRHKAESYMVQLVKLMPTIELIDLYISDNIQAIFKNVKTEYLKQQKYVREHDVYGHPMDSTNSKGGKDTVAVAAPGKRKSNKAVWWTLSGVGAAAATAGVVYFVATENEPNESGFNIKP